MFDISWSEILVIAVLAIVFIGPRDLPKVMRTAGRMVRKARLMASEFQDSIEQMAHEAELDEVKKSIHHVSNFDPKKAIENTIDPVDTFPHPPVIAEDEIATAAKPKKPRAPRKQVKPKAAPTDDKDGVGK